MIGIIKRCNMPKAKPVNPDDYFDPSTHIATEANFIAFLEAGGKYDDTNLIGYKVVLSNTAAYNGGTWIIADVNHDSTNTNQTNCYDLISQETVYTSTFGSNQNWRESTIRTWLNSTFYEEFSSDFKNHIMNIKYNSQGTWYNDDRIIIPSWLEVNGTIPYDYSNKIALEGVKYPIFESAVSARAKGYIWWGRSRYTNSDNNLSGVRNDGYTASLPCNLTYNIIPILRVQ